MRWAPWLCVANAFKPVRRPIWMASLAWTAMQSHSFSAICYQATLAIDAYLAVMCVQVIGVWANEQPYLVNQ